MKKILIIILTLCYVLTCNLVYAQEDYFGLKYIYNEADNNVEIVVDIENASGICGFSFNIVYDNTTLSIDISKTGEAMEGKNVLINDNYSENSIRVVCAGVIPIENVGNIVKVNFSILENANTVIKLEDVKISDSNGKKTKLNDINCNITLVEETVVQPTHRPSSGIAKPQNNKETGNNKTDYETNNILPLPFTDVKDTDWYYEAVKFAYDNNLMKGVSESEFAPNNMLTRAMLVTILYRNAGEPVVNNSIPFADVDMNAWYANAVVWAKQNGIVNGVNETDFAPDNNITREQIAAIMHRYAQYKGYDVSVGENTNILSYDDAESISEYAIASMQYVVGSGLIKGKSATTLNPSDNATRAEIAAILQRFVKANNILLKISTVID